MVFVAGSIELASPAIPTAVESLGSAPVFLRIGGPVLSPSVVTQ